MDKYKFKKSGGDWLGAVRSWIQWNCINGSSVTWGSHDELKAPIDVARLEDAAGDAAWEVIEPFYDTKKGTKAMILMQMSEGKKLADILSDMYKEMQEVAKHFNVEEISIDLPEEVTRKAEEARLGIIERNGDNIFLQSLWMNITQKLWEISHKIKWKIY